ncbi:MAG: serine hydrolase [bacterium]|nr:serine hydrolase [bacterium]
MSQATDPLPVGAPDALGFCPTRLLRLDSYLYSACAGQSVPVAAVLVARHGQIACQVLVGQRDIEAGLPMQADTICRIVSMSKPITSVAVMMLLEQGRLQLEDPIAMYIHEFAAPRVLARGGGTVAAEGAISIRHLLTHTSGLCYGLPDPRLRAVAASAGLLDGAATMTRLLGRKTVDRMATNSMGALRIVIDAPHGGPLHGDAMGLGVGIRADRGRFGGLESVGSFGWGGAFHTVFWVDPMEDLIGIVMSQRLMRMDFLQTCRTLVYQALVD